MTRTSCLKVLPLCGLLAACGGGGDTDGEPVARQPSLPTSEEPEPPSIPGRGELDIRFILEELVLPGYAGPVGCEYVPRAGPLSGLGWVAAWGIAGA